MIRYLRHTEINKFKWDQCIEHSVDRRIYAFSWYLDRVCPDWEALVDGDYRSVFPLTRNRRFGINYLFQPFFTQQLGIFSCFPPEEEKMTAFFEAIPGHFRFAEICMHGGMNFTPAGWKATGRINHELSLNAGAEEIRSRYDQNTRRNVRKVTEKDISPGEPPSPAALVALFRETFGKREGKLRDIHYQTAVHLITDLIRREKAHTEGMYDRNGRLMAGACLAFDRERYYFLFAASAPQARENGAMFLLIDRFIRQHAGQKAILDFEGGNDPGVGRFYKGFGGTEAGYLFLSMNRLPLPCRMVYNFKL